MIETVRGGGIRQAAIGIAATKLDEGQHVHLFPEGKILCELDHDLHKFKWGVGQILMETRTTPHVVPMHIHGKSVVSEAINADVSRLRYALDVVARAGVSAAVAAVDKVWFARQSSRRGVAERCDGESGRCAVGDYGSAAGECRRVG